MKEHVCTKFFLAPYVDNRCVACQDCRKEHTQLSGLAERAYNCGVIDGKKALQSRIRQDLGLV